MEDMGNLSSVAVKAIKNEDVKVEPSTEVKQEDNDTQIKDETIPPNEVKTEI